MVSDVLIQIKKDPRGSEQSLPTALPSSVNTTRRRARVMTMSSLESHYDSLHELRTSLKAKITAIIEATTTLLTLSKSDEITQLATTTSTTFIDAQVIVNNYVRSVAQLRTTIEDMDESSEKTTEQQIYEEQMRAEDAGNNLPIGDVSV